MSKFKVGGQVRVADWAIPEGGIRPGEVGTVMRVWNPESEGDGYQIVTSNGRRGDFYESELMPAVIEAYAAPHSVDPKGYSGRGPADESDPVNHPPHYTSDPSGVECIEVTRHRNFNIGNAIKYLWRAGLKDSDATVQDLRKAVWYINDEIERLEATN